MQQGMVLASVYLLASWHPATAMENWEATHRAVEYAPMTVLQEAKTALRNAEGSGDKAAQLRALRRLGEVQRVLAIPVIEDLDRGIALARALGETDALCWFLQHTATAMSYRAVGDELSAMSGKINALFDEASTLAGEHKLDSCLAWTYLGRGSAAESAGQTSDAMGWNSNAYALFETQNNHYGMALALAGIAKVFLIPGSIEADYKKRAEYLQRALTLIDPLVYRRFAAETYLRIGQTALRRKNALTSRLLFEKARRLAHLIRYDRLAGIAELELADLDMQAQHYAEALSRIDAALRSISDYPDRYYHVVALILRAEALARLDQVADSTDALSRAQEEARKSGNAAIAAAYHRRAAQVYAQIDDYRAAYRQMAALHEVDLRDAQEANLRLASENKIRFHVQLKETENALLRAQQKEADSRRLILVLTLALSLTLLGGVAFYFGRRTAAARMEAAHHKALATAEASANQAKSEFLANMSHELRSPLNAILGFARIVARNPNLPHEAENDMAIVVRSGEHLYQLINQVLDLSKIERGHIALSPAVFDLRDLLEELEDMFALPARQKGLQLRIECHPQLPHAVYADAGKLRQVLINLLGNAVKFTNKGEVALRVDPDPRSVNYLAFTVSDTGPGITDEGMSRNGPEFAQTLCGVQCKEGAGLGLAISRRFVQLMGGALNLTGKAGHGTIATFSIAAAAAHETIDARAERKRRQVIGLAPDQPRYRILVVDDRADGRQLLLRLLAPLGFDVREAANGEQAIACWEEWQPHLICMDMRMPVMDGREATRRIKATEQGNKTVIIAITASSFDEQREAILANGCDDFLRKPFQESALFDLLGKHLGVAYVCDDAADPSSSPVQDKLCLAGLPAPMRARLDQALASLEVNAVTAVIGEVCDHDPTLGKALATMSADFDYARIQALLHERP